MAPATTLDDLVREYGEVQRAAQAKSAPQHWLYELKFAGRRVLAMKSGASVRLVDRHGSDVTTAFPLVARDVTRLRTRTCVLDGELCALDDRGLPSLELLQGRRAGTRLAYFVFDALRIGAADLRPSGLEDRRERLARLVNPLAGKASLHLSAATDAEPATVLQLACASGIAGIVAKEPGSAYHPGRSNGWRVIACGRETRHEQPRAVVAGVALSHQDRVLTPTAVTKLQLARYYEAVGRWMVPHVRGRPLTLLRWAEGGHGADAGKGGVFLRHAKAWGPNVLRRVRIAEKTKIGEYLVADDVEGLVGLAQMDILEIHTWNSTAEDVERPDRIVIDLDPAPDVRWGEVVRAAKDVRIWLQERRLESWVKTTGGKGLHVVVPLRPASSWTESADFARELAVSFAEAEPARFVARMAKSERGGRIFLDYLRNHRTNTSVAAYSLRARAGGPVSVPVTWEELEDVDPHAFTLPTVRARIDQLRRDPWSGYWTRRQSLRPRRRAVSSR